MDRVRILGGDCRAVLPTLEHQSVQCCVTSPPYWGLRDYGIDSQLGLETTPEEYIQKMVVVFREVWRVLRDDGTLWLNMGDSYASGEIGRHDNVQGQYLTGTPVGPKKFGFRQQAKLCTGLKPKDLCGIPWRLAFALQADGWYLRSDIIWHKPNPMPESVTDRPTKAHEYIFLLTKRERYFYDADAIREKAIEGNDLGLLRGKIPGTSNNVAWHTQSILDRQSKGVDSKTAGDGFRNKRTVWTIATQPYRDAHFATFPDELPKPCILAGSKPGDTILDPFAGSGTVGKVALELGRRAILIELSAAYVELARERTNVTPSLFCNGQLDKEPDVEREPTFSFMDRSGPYANTID